MTTNAAESKIKALSPVSIFIIPPKILCKNSYWHYSLGQRLAAYAAIL
jgi:hypothetical protein